MWSVYLTNSEGVRLADLSDNYGFEFTRVKNSVGAWNVRMGEDFDDTILRPNHRIEIWRALGGESLLLFSGLVKDWKRRAESPTVLTMTGPCMNHLLARRVIVQDYGTGVDGTDRTILMGTRIDGEIWSSEDDGASWTMRDEPALTAVTAFAQTINGA